MLAAIERILSVALAPAPPVIPGVAVAWWACWGVIIHRGSYRSSTKSILWLIE